jgi:N-methylhydantoinase B
VLEYSLIPNSGGAGEFRGGLGTRRIMRIEPGAEVTVNALFDRTKPGFGAWGLENGGKGGRGAVLVKRAGDTEFRTFTEAFGTVSPSKFTNILLREGDEVLIDSPGGGGYGDPKDRERARVEEDLFQGFITPDAARDVYGTDGSAPR